MSDGNLACKNPIQAIPKVFVERPLEDLAILVIVVAEVAVAVYGCKAVSEMIGSDFHFVSSGNKAELLVL